MADKNNDVELEKEVVENFEDEQSVAKESEQEIPDSLDNEEVSIEDEQFTHLEEELAKEKEEKDKYIDRLQHLQAEFANYRKRVVKEKSTLAEQTTRDFVLDLLPIIDNFERALAAVGDNEEVANILQGVEMIHRQLNTMLEKIGVSKIVTVGEEFDPNLHEAVMKEVSDEYESGVVMEELQSGYKFNDFIIRPAMVKVAE